MVTGPEHQMADLSNKIATLERRMGELAGQLVELNVQLAPFLTRYQREVLDYHNELVQIQRQIADARLQRGERRASSAGSASTALSRLVEDSRDITVQQQYERVWKGKHPPSPTDVLSESGLPPASEEVKALFAELVARLHPELADTPQERDRRRGLMREVNLAYLKRDVVSLRAVAEAHRARRHLPAIVDAEAVAAMRRQVAQLEHVIMKLEGRVFELRHGDAAKIMAFTAHASKEGYDLLSELSRALQLEIDQAHRQLARLQTG